MILSSYLHKRPNSQHWQLRMMVPRNAVRVVGRREFTKSLRTTEKRKAEELALPILASWKAQIAALAASVERPCDALEGLPYRTPTQSELDEVALLIGYERASDRLQSLIATKARLGSESFDDLRLRFERRYADAVRNQLAGDHSYWRDIAVTAVQGRHWNLPEDSDPFEKFVANLARCGSDLFAKAMATFDGEGDKFVPSKSVQALSQARTERSAPGEALLDLFSIYSAQRLAEGKKRKDTLVQDEKVVRQFAEFVGQSRAIRSIKPEEVREFRNCLAALPAAYRKRKCYADMTMRDAATHATKSGDKGVSLVTVNKNLSAVSSLFTWARREGYADANPCDGLFYDTDKRRNPRPPFSVDQLNRLLSSPLFTGFKTDGKEFLPGTMQTRDWRFWVPLICMFTGARVGEIAQLRVEDIQQEGEHWFIQIRHEQRKGQSTKTGVSRPAPVHSKLRRIGFLDFVAKQRNLATATGDGKLFPELCLNERGQNGKASRFWRTYLQRIGLKSTGDGGDGLGSHSFRHGLADQLRKAGHFDNDIAVALGHTIATVTSGYGRLRQGTVARLSQIIESAEFEGVEFAHLIPEDG